MKKSLNINATRNGKKVSKNIGYVNPDAPNSLVGAFAQMVNGLTNDTYVNSEVVKKMDTTEEEQTPTPAPAGKTEGVITVTEDSYFTVNYNGDGELYCVLGYEENEAKWVTIQSGENISDYINDNSWNYPNGIFVFAPETDNYTAAVYTIY